MALCTTARQDKWWFVRAPGSRLDQTASCSPHWRRLGIQGAHGYITHEHRGKGFEKGDELKELWKSNLHLELMYIQNLIYTRHIISKEGATQQQRFIMGGSASSALL